MVWQGSSAQAVVSPADLAEAVAGVSDDLRAQYELAFEPLNGLDGKVHAIAVKTRNSQFRVRARRAYVAAAQ